eukprot:scaffold279656_cov30-Tisochrysis_lutea.AAC.3
MLARLYEASCIGKTAVIHAVRKRCHHRSICSSWCRWASRVRRRASSNCASASFWRSCSCTAATSAGSGAFSASPATTRTGATGTTPPPATRS